MRIPPRHTIVAGAAVLTFGAFTFTSLATADPASAQAEAAAGELSVLSYNVAGLPEGFSSGDPEANTPIIGSRLAPYDIVQVQEDFNYHAALYAADSHEHRTATSGGVPFGDGLNTLSDYAFEDFARVKWKDCNLNSGDCLTPKGFTFMRARLAEGAWVDLYNLHADAGSDAGDLDARAKNLAQLSAYIQSHSAGNAVIVYGDTNTRYTRETPALDAFTAASGLTDAWVELERAGDAPNQGDEALVCDDAAVTDACEVVDKVFYRSGDYVGLSANDYRNDNAAFRTDDGKMLSDHYPIAVDFDWSTDASLRLSDQFGGPHGDFFTDVDEVDAGDAASALRLRAGERVDMVGLTLADGTVLDHGGSGGRLQSLDLAAGEYPVSLRVCQGKHNGHTRIFYARWTTSTGRTIAGGTDTGDCATFTASSGWQIAGFQGRAGAAVDKLGVVYTQA